jgi:hypothetical protein
MIVEVRTYTVKPGKTAEYLRLYQSQGLAVQSHHLGRLLGYYESEVGNLNQIIHMWAYDDYTDRDRRRAALFSDQRWLTLVAQLYELIDHMENKIVTPTSFSPAILERDRIGATGMDDGVDP